MNQYIVYLRRRSNASEKITILSDEPKYKFFSSTLTMSLNNAGSFRFVLMPDHPHIDEFKKPFEQYIDIYVRDEFYSWYHPIEGYNGDECALWRGRVTSIDTDTYGKKTITCEGILATLNDIYIQQGYGTGTSVAVHLMNFFNDHNNMKGNIGIERFSFNPSIGGSTSWLEKTKHIIFTDMTTLEVLNKKVLDRWGGYFACIPKPTTNEMVYYRTNALPTDLTPQIMSFGDNVKSISVKPNYGDVHSGIMVVGGDNGSGGNYHLSNYIKWDSSLVNTFGKIAKKVISTDDTSQADLNDVADSEIAKIKQRIQTVYEVECIDKAFMSDNCDITSMFVPGRIVKLYDPVKRINITNVISKMVVDVTKPAIGKYTVGIQDKAKISNIK